MANKRISELSSLNGNISSEDLFLVQDVSPISESKSVTWGYLSQVIAASASVESSSYSLTSSFSQRILSASWASSSITSSFSLAGSGSGIYAISSSWAASSSYCLTASFASGSGVFSYSGSYAFTSSYSLSGSTSLTASYSISASYASGSNIIANSSSFAHSSSHAATAKNSNYSSNGIETGYMVLYAGQDTSAIESTGNYLVCNGRDVFVNSYQNLYNSIGKKFGFYPELTITASRSSTTQAMRCEVYHDNVNIYGWALSSGIVAFHTQSFGDIKGLFTITSIKAGISGSSKILSNESPSAIFYGLGADEYRFIITEQNTNSSSIYPVSIHILGENYTESVNFGPYFAISFSPSSNVAYSSNFSVTDTVTDQTSVGYLRQTSPAAISHLVPAELLLPDSQAFTCSISRYSGSYNDMPTASLRMSSQTLEFSGLNNNSFVPITKVFSSSFFIPNVNATGSIPENLSPRNSQITSSGYNYAFRYLIKT
jgi:hypothetical protein